MLSAKTKLHLTLTLAASKCEVNELGTCFLKRKESAQHVLNAGCRVRLRTTPRRWSCKSAIWIE